MSETDFIVVGGGLYGAAIAYELAERGASVTVLERNTVASGASGGPGKRGIRTVNRDSRELPLARHSLELWPNLADVLGSDIGFEPLGGLWLVESSQETGHIGLSSAQAQVSLLNAHGIAARVIGKSELTDIEGEFSDEVVAAIYCEGDAIASQELTTNAYVAAARVHGVDVREHANVVEIVPGAAPEVRLADGESLTARKKVIVAANSYTRDLLEKVWLAPMWRMAPQGLFVESKHGYQPRHLIGHTNRPLSIKPVGETATMISGGMRGLWHEPTDQGVLVDQQVAISLELASAVITGLRDAQLVSATASRPESYTADGIPVVDDCADGVVVASGWSGHGFAIAPSMSKLIAEWLSTDQKPAHLQPFGRNRLLAQSHGATR